ncbi:MAG: ABC transporter permease [Alphaproteobacteria bacterium]|nr:ABC transporter permease [Alphaproteobacteria bacterium]
MVVLAMRNLFRNTRRTLITVLAITFGLAMVHLTITLQTGSYADLIRTGVSSMAGHVVVQAKGYQEEKDGDLVLTRTAEISQRLAKAFPEGTIAPRLVLGGLITSPRGSVGAAVSGIDGAAEAKLQEIDEHVVQGTWLTGDARGIVIGRDMADALQVGLGDKVVYMGQHGGATEVSSRLFRVIGIFRMGNADLDGFVAFVDLPAAQEAFGQPDVANQVTVHLPDPNRSPAAAAEARTLLADIDGIEVLDWKQALPELFALIEVDKTSGDVMLFLLGAIVAMGALNTVLMAALERTREFGVMLALGLRPQQLARLILTEGLLLGLMGAGLGLVVGTALSWPLVHYGLDYSAYMGDTYETAGVVLSSVIKGRFNPLRMTTYTIAATFMTAAAAIYPAVQVARLQPVEAMRHT